MSLHPSDPVTDPSSDVERRLRRLLDLSPSALVELDTAGRVVFANESAGRLLRLGTTDADETPPTWSAIAGAPTFTRVLGGEVVHAQSVSLQDPDTGAPLSLRVTLHPLRDEQGTVTGALAELGAAGTAAPEPIGRWELRLRRLVETYTQSVWWTDPTGAVLEPIPSWQAFTGLTFEQSRGMGWLQAVHPDDREPTRNGWLQAVRTLQPFEIEHRVRRHDGAWRVMRAHCVPVLDGGVVREWVGAHTDVTEQRRSEAAHWRLADAALAITRCGALDEVLEEITRQARHILDAHRAVTRLAADGHWSPATSAVSLSDEYAARPEGAVRFDDGAMAAEVCRLNRPMRLTRAELASHPAWRGAGADGRTEPPAYGWLAAPLLGRSGENIGVIELTDRSDGEFSESDEAILVQLAQMASAHVERVRLMTSAIAARAAAEAAAARMAALQSATSALGRAMTPGEVADAVLDQGVALLGARRSSVAVVDEREGVMSLIGARGYPPEVLERFGRVPLSASFPLADVARTGEAIFLATSAERDERYPNLRDLRRSNGEGAMAALPLVVDGRVIGAIGVNLPVEHPLQPEDRTFLLALSQQCAQALERARLLESERAARAEAELANRAKSEFLAAMSHELRTPLNAIGGYVELLRLGLRGDLTEHQQRDLDRVKRSQEHLLGLINDVLHFARLDAGRVQLEMSLVSVSESLATVEGLVAPQIATQGHRYEVEACDPELRAWADPERLAQILVNLLTNAIKYTEPGGRITVRCEPRGEVIALGVTDTGIGIPPEKLEAIFDPFVQVGRQLNRPRDGVGLGLAISRELARAMGGELTVESEVGRGSTFTLVLPARPPAA